MCLPGKEQSDFEQLRKKYHPKLLMSTHFVERKVKPDTLVIKTAVMCSYGLAVNSKHQSSLFFNNCIYRKQRELPEANTMCNSMENSCDCVELTQYFEKKYNIPNGLLLAIACVESTKRPWAVNNFRESRYFDTKNDACRYIKILEQTRQLSISVGFMQINWIVHKSNFKNLNQAISPYYNVKFAAELLSSLYKRYGSWEKAIAWYNPKGNHPNYEYLQKIRRHCHSAQII
jgi:hypothetical protein